MGIVGEDITNFLVCLHLQAVLRCTLGGKWRSGFINISNFPRHSWKWRNLPDNVSKQKCGRHLLNFATAFFYAFNYALKSFGYCFPLSSLS